jgi:ADP-heptose:LPS heptosyltransferase
MLRSTFQSARIILVGPPSVGRVLEGVSIFDEHIVLPWAAFDFNVGPPRSLYQGLARVQRLSPDLIFASYPMNTCRIGDMIDRLGARWVVGTEDDAEPRQMTFRLPVPRDRHVVQINADLARAVGCKGPTPPLQLWPNEKERKKAAQWLEKHAPKRPRVGFHIGSIPGLSVKKWPEEYFVGLGNRLAVKRAAQIILLEGPEERPLVKKVVPLFQKPPAVAGLELSLRETIALVEQMDVLVAGSSVWMHVATAVGTPVVALIGPTPPSYNPWGNPERYRLIKTPAECAPCWIHGQLITCKDPHCMRDISVSQVETEVNDLLNRTMKINSKDTQTERESR